jgi:hypothetical protein
MDDAPSSFLDKLNANLQTMHHRAELIMMTGDAGN